ncbi:16S rRNA (cytidine(1402)-2'-O)-methyltransferase [Pueribacillus sp. YX66]|uniref:16S rRNA (cytidine(1402)-2'-O)-methyltransferase n=1 Tax=Pueribacillus sp. YX66 TaxID=3229242 RepID=UPI00358D9A7E
MNKEASCLYLVPTPIGNLNDMTFRSVETLRQVDLIAAEDTRVTLKLCRHFKISTPLVSYHEHNKEKQGIRLIEQLHNGKTIALVSDAGTPAISDPGSDLVAMCIQEQIDVVPLPGANAAITALIASGLFEKHFYFYGFLPRTKKEKQRELESLIAIRAPLIFYEAPHRLKETLHSLLKVFGERKAVLARELTKRYEEFVRGTLDELIEWTMERDIRGEFCIVVAGNSDEIVAECVEWWHRLTVIEHVEHYIERKNCFVKEAVKRVAQDRGMSKRDVYQTYHSR